VSEESASITPAAGYSGDGGGEDYEGDRTYNNIITLRNTTKRRDLYSIYTQPRQYRVYRRISTRYTDNIFHQKYT